MSKIKSITNPANVHLGIVAAHKPDHFSSVAFSPDGRMIASGSNDETVKVWDANTGKPLRTLEGHSNQVN